MRPRTSPKLPVSPDVQIESDQRVWSGRFPLDVIRFRNRRFDGAMSGLRTWEMWRRGKAVAMLPYDPAAGLDPVLVELPAGLLENGDIRVRVWPAAKAIEAALDGALSNAITAIGLLWLAARRDTLRQRWLAP